MNSRERLHTIIAGQIPDHCGFWLGNPDPDTWRIYYTFFGTTDQQVIRQQLGDDFLWVCPELTSNTYRHHHGLPLFAATVNQTSHGAPGPLAKCERVEDLENFEWPKAANLDFEPCLEALRTAGCLYRASGMWTPFFHTVMALFGFEDYLTKMYTHPDLVLAVTDRVCSFYYEANERLFASAGNLIDGYFFWQ